MASVRKQQMAPGLQRESKIRAKLASQKSRIRTLAMALKSSKILGEGESGVRSRDDPSTSSTYDLMGK